MKRFRASTAGVILDPIDRSKAVASSIVASRTGPFTEDENRRLRAFGVNRRRLLLSIPWTNDDE
jgi:hypothetical protein